MAGSIVLERRQSGADPQGFVGLEDEVDQRWNRLTGSANLLKTLERVKAIEPSSSAWKGGCDLNDFLARLTKSARFRGLVHRPCDVGQGACPIPNGLFAPILCGGDRPKNVPERRHRYAGLTDRPINRFSFLTYGPEASGHTAFYTHGGMGVAEIAAIEIVEFHSPKKAPQKFGK
jgi:hypothetical protein